MPSKTPSELLAALVTRRYPIPAEVWGDFWDRLERQILPAMRAGMVALVDRYIFSLMARARVRGLTAEWARAPTCPRPRATPIPPPRGQ